MSKKEIAPKEFDCGCVVQYHPDGVLAGINWCSVHGYFYNRIYDTNYSILTGEICSKFGLPTDYFENQDGGKGREIMSEDSQKIIKLLLGQPEVDDVLPLLKDAPAMELADGRLLLPLNIYLNKPAPEGGSLGLAVEDGVGVDDVFGGV